MQQQRTRKIQHIMPQNGQNSGRNDRVLKTPESNLKEEKKVEKVANVLQHTQHEK